MKRGKKARTPESPKPAKPPRDVHAYDWRDRAGRGHDGKFSRD